jgi:hypothetical protein
MTLTATMQTSEGLIELVGEITTNEIKKGDRILQVNGWFGTMYDNKKGNIRMAEVEGLYTEIGSVYSHDIVAAQKDGVWHVVKHTDAQDKVRDMNSALFG